MSYVNPKISVIIPLYNHEKYIKEAVHSVLEQSFPDFELIVINHGSTDKSEELVKAIKDERIKYICQENQGAHNAINTGIQHARGEYISILNSDDAYYTNRFEEALKLLEADSSLYAVFSHLEFIDEKGAFLRYYRGAEDLWNELNPGIAYKDTNDIVFDLLGGNFLISTSNLFCRKSTFDNIGYFTNLKYAHDYDFFLRLCIRHKVFVIDIPLLKYRVHPLNTLKKNEAELRFEVGLVLTNFLLNHGIDKIFKENKPRYDAMLHLFNAMNPCNSDKLMITLLLYAVGHKAEMGDILKELTDNVDNTLRKGFIDSVIEAIKQIADRDKKISEKDKQIQLYSNSYSWKITKPIRIGYRLYKGAKSSLHSDIKPYHVRLINSPNKNRPRIVHALGNFLTGGSSRLAVDLIEHLGHLYEQEIITCDNPVPPHYTGVVVREFKMGAKEYDKLMSYFKQYNPDIVHIHYWGDKDARWYEQVFAAAQKHRCRIIENINTPVRPYFSGLVNKYVYVSKYVQDTFGRQDDKSITIYPGSNFDIFKRPVDSEMPDDCIGMVYRLESDKLNQDSIDVFIKVLKLRPTTRILIVGGGALLDYYKQTVAKEGKSGNFEFTGYLPYEQLPEYYNKLSIFVAPVWKESFGQVSPFAMNMGIPVVGYDVGALAEIIGDKELLAPPGDSDKLADIITSLLDDRGKRLSIGKKNRQRAKELFSVESMIRSYEGLYRDLLKS